MEKRHGWLEASGRGAGIGQEGVKRKGKSVLMRGP